MPTVDHGPSAQAFARYYLEVLQSAQALYLKGADSVSEAIAWYEREEHNIAYGQHLAAAGAQDGEESWCRLVASYGRASGYLIFMRVSPQEWIRWLEDQLQACTRLEDLEGAGAAHGNLGNAYAYLGDMSMALKHHKSCLLLAKRRGHLRDQCNAVGSLANDYAALPERSNEAIQCYRQQLRMVRQLSDPRGESLALNNLGVLYRRLARPQRAKILYNHALRIASYIGDLRLQAAALGNLCNIHDDAGNLQQAQTLAEQTLEICRQLGDRRFEASTLASLGSIHAARDHMRVAQDCFEQQLTIAREVSDRPEMIRAFQNLATVYKTLGEHAKAADAHEQAESLTHLESGTAVTNED